VSSWIAALILATLGLCEFVGWPDDYIWPSYTCAFLFFVAALLVLPSVWRRNLSAHWRHGRTAVVILLVVGAAAIQPVKTRAVRADFSQRILPPAVP
jgi:hypothetical protein